MGVYCYSSTYCSRDGRVCRPGMPGQLGSDLRRGRRDARQQDADARALLDRGLRPTRHGTARQNARVKTRAARTFVLHKARLAPARDRPTSLRRARARSRKRGRSGRRRRGILGDGPRTAPSRPRLRPIARHGSGRGPHAQGGRTEGHWRRGGASVAASARRVRDLAGRRPGRGRRLFSAAVWWGSSACDSSSAVHSVR